jgi:hypothetical protein
LAREGTAGRDVRNPPDRRKRYRRYRRASGSEGAGKGWICRGDPRRRLPESFREWQGC